MQPVLLDTDILNEVLKALEHGRILVTGAPFLVDSRAYDRKLA
jgi:hypothetical protein